MHPAPVPLNLVFGMILPLLHLGQSQRLAIVVFRVGQATRPGRNLYQSQLGSGFSLIPLRVGRTVVVALLSVVLSLENGFLAAGKIDFAWI